MSRAMSNDFLGLIYFRRENEMDGESRYLKKKISGDSITQRQVKQQKAGHPFIN